MTNFTQRCIDFFTTVLGMYLMLMKTLFVSLPTARIIGDTENGRHSSWFLICSLLEYNLTNLTKLPRQTVDIDDFANLLLWEEV